MNVSLSAPGPLDVASTLQFAVRKAEYIIGLAQEVAARRLDLDALGGRENEEVIETLTRVRGFGRWTAEWFLARCLGRPDVVAAGDLGVRKAVARWFSDDPIWPEGRVREAMQPFGRHTNLAVHYLLLPTGG